MILSQWLAWLLSLHPLPIHDREKQFSIASHGGLSLPNVVTLISGGSRQLRKMRLEKNVDGARGQHDMVCDMNDPP